jgi:hypothetical protein
MMEEIHETFRLKPLAEGRNSLIVDKLIDLWTTFVHIVFAFRIDVCSRSVYTANFYINLH